MCLLGRCYACLVRTTCQSDTVVVEVISQKCGNEVVAVVVTGLYAQAQRMTDSLARGLQKFRAQLAG